MTKQVRIENADTNTSFKLVVITEDRVYDPVEKKMTDNWVEVKREALDYPTALLTTYITDTRRLRIEEAK